VARLSAMDSTSVTDDKTTDGWDDDDLDLIDEWEIDDVDNNDEDDAACVDVTRAANETYPPNTPEDPTSIQGYFQYLKTGIKPDTPISLTTTAEALRVYYESRPNLKTYTLEKEVHRMDYVVVQVDGTVLEGADAIRSVFWREDNNLTGDNADNDSEIDPASSGDKDSKTSDEELLWRASNQSILADVLASITDLKGLVRPQFMATAVARSVSFRIDFAKGCTDCRAAFAIMIPFEKDGDASMLELATVEVQLTYNIDALSCTILQVQTNPSLDASNDLEIAAAQQYIAEDSFSMPVASEAAADRSFLNDQQRDAFIVEGIGGAWKQLDETTGISNKIGAVSTYFTKDLKSCLEDYEQEMLEVEIGAGNAVNNVAASSAVQRPESLLGGMFGGLAKVALSAAQGADKSHNEPIQFYRREEMELKNDMVMGTEPKAQNTEPKVHNDVAAADGWSDDELDFDSNLPTEKISVETEQKTSKIKEINEAEEFDAISWKNENERYDERILTRKRWIRPLYTEYVFTH